MDHDFVCKMAQACVILHNCCVEERIANGEIKLLDIYDFDEVPKSDAPTATKEEVCSKEKIVKCLYQDFQEQFSRGLVTSDPSLQERINVLEVLPLRCCIALKR